MQKEPQIEQKPVPARHLNEYHNDTNFRAIRRHLTSAQPMCRRVRNALIRTSGNSTRFLPHSSLERALGGNAAVLDLFRLLKQPIIEKSPERFYSILAVLCLMERPTKIKVFVDCGICDADLPLERHPHSTANDNSCLLRSTKKPDGPFVQFKKLWDATDFLRHQWSVLALKFPKPEKTRILYIEISSDVLLPYSAISRVHRRSGFGDVYKVEIHPRHHDFEVCLLFQTILGRVTHET